MASDFTHLAAIEKALRIANRPLTSKEIYEVIQENDLAQVNGLTPWKTLAARLSQDILNKKDRSAFKRTFSGRYAIREWSYEPEFIVKRRRINPLEETIKAVPHDVFLGFLNNKSKGLYQLSLTDLLTCATDIVRQEAEARNDLVQLIPTFVVEDRDNIVSYKRTKRLPETRLHYSLCLNFGGHLQSDDIPTLFLGDETTLHSFMYRELFEELEFSSGLIQIDFEGILYLTRSSFERQHAGLVYRVLIEPSAELVSLEPGMHTDIRKLSKVYILEHLDIFDSWSSHLASSMFGKK